jgi:hypothetical protein
MMRVLQRSVVGLPCGDCAPAPRERVGDGQREKADTGLGQGVQPQWPPGLRPLKNQGIIPT